LGILIIRLLKLFKLTNQKKEKEKDEKGKGISHTQKMTSSHLSHCYLTSHHSHSANPDPTRERERERERGIDGARSGDQSRGD